VRVLLDTHVVLWSLFEPERLARDAVHVLSSPDTERVVSVATLWEIAIKRAAGRLVAPDDLPDFLSGTRHEFLPVLADHAWRVAALPMAHGDPFDRLLVAQAQVEGLPLVTHDRQLDRYDVRIIRA
jgi:PIN domain nuclease of toxin-antitoxin system